MALIAVIGPIARMLGLEPWQIGVALSLSGAAWTILARVWGRASDLFGRRRIMLVGLGGFAMSCILLATFMDAALLWPLPTLVAFLGIALCRASAGAFYAAVPASSVALIVDRHTPDRRAQAIAALGAANGLGMALGPAAAGLLAQYGMTYALVFIATLPALAFVALWRTLPRDGRAASKTPALRLLDERLRTPLAVALVAMLCVAVAQVTVGFYALDRLGLTPLAAARTAGIALAAVGVALIAAQTLVRTLNWSERRLIRTGAAIAGLGFGLAIFAVDEPLLWFSYFVGAFGMGFIFPAFFALAANSVDSHEQGSAAGAISSIQGLGSIVGPFAGALIYQVDMRAPYVLIAVLLVATSFFVRDRVNAHSSQRRAREGVKTRP